MLSAMRILRLYLVYLCAEICLAQQIKYWVHTTCGGMDGAFDIAMKDARFTAQRALMRLNSLGPYTDDIFQLLFGQPRIDAGTFNRVQFIYETIANRLVETKDQLTSNIRFYCDDDEHGPGKRWTITPNQPGDPIYAKNDQLPRQRKDTDPEGTFYQMWQDETNWVRMSRGSQGCKDAGTNGETQYLYWQPEQAPNGIGIPRCTITWRISELEAVKDEFLILTSFKRFAGDLAKHTPLIEAGASYSRFIWSQDILHELTHIPYDQFRTVDHTYSWAQLLTLPAAQKVDHAENYAAFGFLARCADKQYRLTMDGVDDAARLAAAGTGNLQFDENLERVGGENEVPT